MGWLRIREDEFQHEVTSLDAMFWSSVLERHDEVNKQLKRRVDKTIAGDLFQSLYAWKPTWRDDTPSESIKVVIQRMESQQEFQQLRNMTVGDKHRAAAAAYRMYRELMREKQGSKSELSTVADFRNQVETFKTMGKPIDEGDSEAMAVYEQLVEGFASSDAQLASSIQGKSMNPEMKMNRYGGFDEQVKPEVEAIKQAAISAIEDLEMAAELQDFDEAGQPRQGLGGDRGEKELKKLFNERMVNSLKANDRLKRILQVAGRMKRIAAAEKSKKPKPATTPMGLNQGNDLSGVLASELSMLDDEDTEGLFWAKYVDRSLMVYDRRDKPREGKGPFVACGDVSGSMSGTPEIEAMAAFIVMARVALSQKRTAAFIPFASYAGDVMPVRNSDDLMQVINANPKVGGGTEFEAPLNKAQDCIEVDPLLTKGDIILISDTGARVSDRWISEFGQRLTKKGDRLFGLIVGGYGERGFGEDIGKLMTTQVSTRARDTELNGSGKPSRRWSNA
jgi:uncharacterized protein with von Willebrand factor type A (vWA) domain